MIEGQKGTAYQIYDMSYSPNQMVFHLQILTLEISWHWERISCTKRWTNTFCYCKISICSTLLWCYTGQKHTFISCQFRKCSFNVYVLIFAWVLGCKFSHQSEFWSPHSSKKNFIDLHFIHYVTNLTRNKRRSRKPHHHFHLPILCFTLQRFPLNTYHSFLILFSTLSTNW